MSDIFNRTSFTTSLKNVIDSFYSLSSVTEDDQNILIRVNTSNLSADKNTFPGSDDIDTFVFFTSADVENTITYQSYTNNVNLNIRDGGFF